MNLLYYYIYKRIAFLSIVLFLISCFFGIAHAQRLSIKADIGNIRSGPGTNYNVIWKVERFHPLFVIKKSNEWYKFRDYERDEGWVHKSLVDSTASVITKSEKCNVRSGPGTGNDIVFTVEKGVPFKVLKRKGKWIQVRHADGDMGWIYESLVW